MNRFVGRLGWRSALLLVVGLATAAGIAYAAVPDGNGVYTACKLNVTGTIRLVDPTLPASSLLSHCTSLETRITWNQQGQPGPQGPQGPQGPAGAAAGPAEDWHVVVTFNPNEGSLFCVDAQNNSLLWSNLDPNSFNGAAYYRDPYGVVHVRGLVKGGKVSDDCGVFRLPEGYLPIRDEFQPAVSSADGTTILPSLVIVHGDNDNTFRRGWVSAAKGSSDAWFSLDGISFRCGPSGVNGCP